MKCYEWDVSTGHFVEVDDPIFDPNEPDTDMDQAIFNAGYHAELSSYEEDSQGATIRVYATDNAQKPRFYIDVMGQNTGIAFLIAKDFPALVETLKQLHPLLTLVGLDQYAAGRLSDQIRREDKRR